MATAQDAASDFVSQSPVLAALRDFERPGFGAPELQVVADQLVVLLRDYYVHLPLKKSSLGIDPVQEASLLADDVRFIPSETLFQRRAFDIIKRMRDRHTALHLPSPWRDMVAFLPFAAETYTDDSGRHVIVSKLMADVGDPAFKMGTEITHWNAVPIGRYIENLSWTSDGANPFARIALAMRSLTVRPLGYVQAPEEDWVSLTFLTAGNAYRTVSIPWRVYLPTPQSAAGAASTEPSIGLASVQQGVDRNTLIVNGTWKDLFSGSAPQTSVAGGPSVQAAAAPAASAPAVNALQNVQARAVKTSSGEWAYIRIYSFDAPDSRAFVTQFANLLQQMPKTGLILDVRANPGGTIPSGEALMALFTRRLITPQPVSFRNSAGIRSLSRVQLFRPWQRSVDMQLETGEIFTQGFSVTTETYLSGVYLAPIVLVIDALCYSTTDFFAAGMQDHGLATIVGIDPVTGAGGANVWSHGTLSNLVVQGGGQALFQLPAGYDFDVAIRRSIRVGPNSGLPVEGLGVFADFEYNMSLRDVLSANEDLIEYAGSILATPAVQATRRT